MRLSPLEADLIRSSVRAFAPEAKLFLYGSRADDSRRGGDIDLLILSERLHEEHKLKILARIVEQLEEQRVDIGPRRAQDHRDPTRRRDGAPLGSTSSR